MASLDEYLARASQIQAPAYDELIRTTEAEGRRQADIYEQQARNTEGKIPLIQQTYKALADELVPQEQTETGLAKKTGEQNIGSARSALASAGIEGAQGAFAAPVTAAQNELTAAVDQIAQKYSMKREALAQESNRDIMELIDRANAYRTQGQLAMSNAAMDIAKAKLDMQSRAIETAKALFSEDMQTRRLNMQIAAQRESDNKKLAAEAQSAAGKYKYEVQKTGDRITGLSFYDDRGMPTSPIQYFIAKGGGRVDFNDVSSVLQQSADPNDKKLLTAISAMKKYGMTDAEIYDAATTGVTSQKLGKLFSSPVGNFSNDVAKEAVNYLIGGNFKYFFGA